jgi:hypothetical protein
MKKVWLGLAALALALPAAASRYRIVPSPGGAAGAICLRSDDEKRERCSAIAADKTLVSGDEIDALLAKKADQSRVKELENSVRELTLRVNILSQQLEDYRRRHP